MTCTGCGAANPPGARFCNACGASLAEKRPTDTAWKRREVTLLFADVVGSTALGENRDAEAIRGVMDTYFDLARKAIEHHGGVVEKFIGDAVMAVFGLPLAHEDDALRAVRAADELKHGVDEINDRLERMFGVRLAIRIGINTGEVVAADMGSRETFATGDAVNVAARLEQAAAPGQILVAASTYQLIRDAVTVEALEPITLKGRQEPQGVFRLVGVGRGVPGRRRPTVELVGRQAELALLDAALSDARRAECPRLVVIVAEPGIGKTRLTEAFLDGVGPAVPSIVGHCVAYGEGSTYQPLIEVLQAAAVITVEDGASAIRDKLRRLAERVSARQSGPLTDTLLAFLGQSSARSTPDRSQFVWAIRATIDALAQQGPLVVLVEDIHWAQDPLLQLLADLSSSLATPVLFVLTTRPEFLERAEIAWATDPPSTLIHLRSLTDAETAELVGRLGGTDVPDEVRRGVATAAGGNALYAAELFAAMRSELAVAGPRDWSDAASWLKRAPLPLSALITARLELLRPDERRALEAMSVVGIVASERAVEALSSEAEGSSVGGTLRSSIAGLEARDLLTVDGDGPNASVRFRHAIVHGVVYQSIPKRRRAELHAAYADWLDPSAPGALTGPAGLIGFHLEQVVRLSLELGPPTTVSQAIAKRAAGHLERAGQLAISRGDPFAAAGLFERAAALLDADDPALPAVLIETGSMQRDVGRSADGRATLSRAAELARGAGMPHLRLRAAAEMLELDPGTPREMVRRSKEIVPELEAAGDHLSLNRAWRRVAIAEADMGHLALAEAAQTQALEHARSAGDRRAELETVVFLVALDVQSPTPVDKALERAQGILATVSGNLRSELFARLWLPGSLATGGHTDEAWAELEAAEVLRQQLSITRWHYLTLQMQGIIASTMPPEQAIPILQKALETATESEPAMVGPMASTLIWSLVDDEQAATVADGLLDQAGMTDEDDLMWYGRSLAAKGRVLAARGEQRDAIDLASRANDVLADTDFLVARADAQIASVEVAVLCGRAPDRRAIQGALRALESKQALPAIRRIRVWLRRLGVSAVD